jgi:fatty acid desaturase
MPPNRTMLAESPPRQSTAAVEAPTLLLILFAFAAWLLVTRRVAHWPLWLVAPLGAVLLTLHASLQHEIIHGHPTRWRAVNRALGMVPLALWLPYECYRAEHLAHHINERLTDPHDDPESYYWTAADWARLNPVSRAAWRLQRTLAGRVVVGSFWRMGRFLVSQAWAVMRNEPHARARWGEHLLWCVPVILWVKVACGLPLWIYFLAIVIPANGILLIRSFAEHRAREAVPERIAIVEGSWILGPLFLFNNLHSLHHREPHIPWYEYNRRYRAVRDELIAANGGLVYASYFDVARRYLLRPQDQLLHPTGRVPVRRVMSRSVSVGAHARPLIAAAVPAAPPAN